MKMHKFEIGDRVVRSKGDYVVGRTGTVIDRTGHGTGYRFKVDWDGYNKTWVIDSALELESVPFKIEKGKYNPTTGKHKYPQYKKL